MSEAVIVATARSAIGRARKGSLASIRPDDLASQVVTGLLAKVPGLEPDSIDDLLLGCAQPSGEHGWNLARVVAALSGLGGVAGATVNRGCASSLEAIAIAANAVKAGVGDCYIAAGAECASRYTKSVADNPPNPRFAEAGRRSARRAAGDAPPWTPVEGLADMYLAMGHTAENVAEYEGVTREQMDEFALHSQQKAKKAIDSGFFADEIMAIRLADGTEVTVDDCPRPDTTLEGLAALEPSFRPDGRVTAGNSCPLNDGAAAVLVMSLEKAEKLGVAPLARVVMSGLTGLNPEIMGLGPVEACRAALGRAKLSMDEIDLVEFNEAFAAQVIPSARRLGIPDDKLNVHGGAIALGHPFGQTGARLMTTLIHGLQVTGTRYGLETMCVGGGQGMAMVVERMT